MQVLRKFPPVIFDGPHTFTLDEFCEWVGISRTKAYAEIRAGRITPLLRTELSETSPAI